MSRFVSLSVLRTTALCLLLAGTLLVRGMYNVQVQETPFSDMQGYEDLSLQILDGRPYGDGAFLRSFLMPGLPVFLAGAYAVFGRQNHAAVQWVYVALSLLMVLMVYDAGRMIYNEEAGLVAALFLSLSKEMTFWGAKPAATEFLFSFWLLLSTYLFLRGLKGRPLLFLPLAGLATGLTYLVRPVVSLVPVIMIALYVYHARVSRRHPYRRVILPFALFSLAFLIAVSPWACRNQRIYGSLFLGSTNGWFTFISGNNDHVYFASPPIPAPTNRLLREAPGRFRNDLEASEHAKEVALQWVREHPVKYAYLTLGRLFHLFTADYVALTRVDYHRLEFYGGVRVPVVGWSPGFLLLLMMAVLFALREGEREGRVDLPKLVPLLIPAGVTLLYVLVIDLPRYRQPLMPLFYLCYGYALVSAFGWVREKRGGGEPRQRGSARISTVT
ncbi:MAG: glycosyltransferase family 39 protein [Thermodesulfobacteriota bacterium]